MSTTIQVVAKPKNKTPKRAPKPALPSADKVASAEVAGQVIKVAGEGDTQLGDVFWFSIRSDWECVAEDMRALWAKHHLHDAWLPREITETSAFKRATELLKEERGKVDDEADDDTVVVRHSVFVRDAPGEHRLRHIVKETRKGRDKPKFTPLGTMEYDAKTGDPKDLHVVYTLDDNVADPALKREFEDMKVRVKATMQHCMQHYTDRDLRNMLDRAVENLHCIPLTRGALFFCPIGYRGILANLQAFMKEVGVRFRILPVAEANLSPEDLAQDLVDTIAARCDVLLRQVVEYAKGPRGLTPGRFDSLMREYQGCTKLLDKYESLLDLEVQAAAVKLQATELRMKEMSRLVKKEA